MSEKKETAQAAPETKAKSKGPVIAIVAVITVVAVGGLFALTTKGNADSDKGQAMSEIAPASADATGEQTAQAAAPVLKEGNPVVATVNGEEITRNDVGAFIANLPEQARQMPLQTLFPIALEQVINNKLVATKASGAELTGDPEVEKLVNQAKDQIIRNVYVDRQIDEKLTEAKLKKAYDEVVKEIGNIDETKARHILVEDEEKAKEVIAKLDGGEDFAELAKEVSSGPSAQTGGELGWFAKNEMVAEFAEAAFDLKPGAHSKAPVQTQFGWHVIKVDDRRKRPAPEYETVKGQLEVQVRQQVLNELLQNWQKSAKIEKFDINGEPVKEN